MKNNLVLFIAAMAAVSILPAWGQEKKKYTKEQLEMAKKYLPKGVILTEAGIEQRMKMARMDSSAGNYENKLPRNAPANERILVNRRKDSALKNEEASRLSLNLSINGYLISDSSGELAGVVVRSAPGRISIQSGTTIFLLDLSGNPGMDVSGIKENSKVNGRFVVRTTPAGKNSYFTLNDESGFVLGWRSGKSLHDTKGIPPLDGIVIKQERQNIGESFYRSACMKKYTPPVTVTGLDNKKEYSIVHGSQKLVHKDQRYYLIKVVKSIYIEKIDCNVSFEEEPWQLDITILRIDDAKKIERLSLDKEKTGLLYKKDDVSEKYKGQGDKPPTLK